MQVIDAHQHLWDSGRCSYSWMRQFPTIQGCRLLDQYRAAVRGINVLESVYIDTDVDDFDLTNEAQMIFALADVPDNRIGGIVAGVRPEKENFLGHLQPFIEHPRLKGVRRVLHTQADGLSEEPRFLNHVRSLKKWNLSFDLCVLARQLPYALQLVRSCPEVSFILDHCGNPDIFHHRLDPWRRDIAGLGKEPNVTCKISGLMTCSHPRELSVNLLRPYVDHVLECFGWDRVIWGSDWPVCTLVSSLARWADLWRELFALATSDQQQRLFRDNAVRIYRLMSATSVSTA